MALEGYTKFIDREGGKRRVSARAHKHTQIMRKNTVGAGLKTTYSHRQRLGWQRMRYCCFLHAIKQTDIRNIYLCVFLVTKRLSAINMNCNYFVQTYFKCMKHESRRMH